MKRVLLLILILLISACRKQARLSLGNAVPSVWDDRVTVATQAQLENAGPQPVTNVTVTRMRLKGGQFTGTPTLPIAVGNLDVRKDKLLDGVFRVPTPNGSRRKLTVQGTYQVAGRQRKFKTHTFLAPNAAVAASIPAQTGQLPVKNPSTVSYPPAPPPPPFRNNAESPIFVPLGPVRQLFPATPTGTGLGTLSPGAAIEIPRNTTMTSAGTPPDPSTAITAPNGVVLSTYNTGISVSTNGGQTFTDINLFGPEPGNPARTTFFPQDDGGLCCDQVVIYVPRQDLFVWVLQYQPIVGCATNCPPQPPPAPAATFRITQPNRLRVAWARPAAVSANFWNAWTYADLTGPGLGTTNAEWLDYPDLAWSDNFVYIGIDHGFPTPGLVYTGRRIVARLSLADMANPAATVLNYGFAELTNSNGLNKGHIVQNAPNQMVVGSLDNASTMRIFTWPDATNSISAATTAISTIPQGANYTSTAPDGSNWVGVSFPGNITGATFRRATPAGGAARDEYLFAFDGGVNAGAGRPHAYLRIETLTPSGGGYTAVEEYDVWNSSYAYAMGALATDGQEIGLSLFVGGGTIGYPQGVVGYKNDFVVYQVTGSNATQISRFGDYVHVRSRAGTFATELYDVILNPLPPGTTSGTCATVGCRANMRFVEFKRPQPIIR